MMEAFLDFLRRNKWRLVLVLIGVVITVLLFTIGFWKTLLLCGIIGVCYLLGALMDEGGRARVGEFFTSLFSKKN